MAANSRLNNEGAALCIDLEAGNTNKDFTFTVCLQELEADYVFIQRGGGKGCSKPRLVSKLGV